MAHPDLQTWLIAQISAKPSLETLFNGFCKKLVIQGLPIWRANIGLETLHPDEIGFSYVWIDGELQERTRRGRTGILTSASYINSPAKYVDDTGLAFHWKAGEPDQGMELLQEFAGEGATDYVMLPLPFLDNARTASVSFATKAPDGF